MVRFQLMHPPPAVLRTQCESCGYSSSFPADCARCRQGARITSGHFPQTPSAGTTAGSRWLEQIWESQVWILGLPHQEAFV